MSGDAARDKVIDEVTTLLRDIATLAHRSAPLPWLDLSISIGQLKSLFFIDYRGSTNLKTLASALGTTPPNVTGIIDRLVDRGLVSREENLEDRRMQVLKTTASGRALLSRLKESQAGRLNEVLARLSHDELACLSSGLSALVQAAKAMQGDRSG